jgi:hypothetical protein
MTDVGYIEILIESEKAAFDPGWQERILHLENQKTLAITISEAQEPNFNPFKKYENGSQSWSSYFKDKIKKFLSFRLFNR